MRDVAEIRDFIARDDSAAAERWLGVLVAAAEQAHRLPQAGRVVPEFKRADLREVLRGNDRLVYRVRKDAVIVETVFEGHKRLADEP